MNEIGRNIQEVYHIFA